MTDKLPLTHSLTKSDRDFMSLALHLGRRGLGRVAPNPAVGCVITKQGKIIGRGWTQPGGRPHAETEALSQAGPEAEGTKVYVTLEPCAHQGKTGPCAEALIKAGVSEVHIALKDLESILRKAANQEQSGNLGRICFEALQKISMIHNLLQVYSTIHMFSGHPFYRIPQA